MGGNRWSTSKIVFQPLGILTGHSGQCARAPGRVLWFIRFRSADFVYCCGPYRLLREATFGKQGQQSAKQASKTGTQQSQTTTAKVNNTQATIQKHQRNSQQTQSRPEPLVNTSPCVRKHETAQSRKHESRKSTNMACSFSQSISLLCIAE